MGMWQKSALIGASGLALAGGLGVTSPGHAQTTQPPFVPPDARCEVGAGTSLTRTCSTSETIVFNPPTDNTAQQQVYRTEIEAVLNGGSLGVRTFALPFSSAQVQAQLRARVAARTNAGGPGIAVFGPAIRTAESRTVLGTNVVTTYSLAGRATTFTAEVLLGPDSTFIRVRSWCDVASLPSTSAPACFNATAPTPFAVVDGSSNANIAGLTTFTIDTVRTGVETTEILERYQQTGSVVPLGLAHGEVAVAGLARAARFGRRIADEGARANRRGLWIEGFRTRSDGDAAGFDPAFTRSTNGIAGGFTARAGAGGTLGVAVEWGKGTTSLPALSDRGELSLLKAGLYGSWRGASGWFVQGSASAGWGHADTANGFAGSSARYDVSTLGAVIEGGRRLGSGPVHVSPTLGLDWQRTRLDGFTESGGFALTSPGSSKSRVRAFAGLAIDSGIERSNGDRIDLRLSGRIGRRLNEGAAVLPVAFSATPTDVLTITSRETSRWSGDASAGVSYTLGSGLAFTAETLARFEGEPTVTGAIGIAYRW
jgi:outer membrane autotransporter protein